MARNIKRSVPNILVTGTPGVGKSTLCKKLETVTGLRWTEISNFAKANACLESFDAEYECPVLDEDKLLDLLEEKMCNGGNIVDYHSSEFFPERWFDAVFVVRTDNTTLYDRLVERGYSGKKLQDNVQCEIFQTLLDEAKSSYKEEIVYELRGTTIEDLDKSVQEVLNWMETWSSENK